MKASELNAGDKVMYLDDIEARVVRVERNGVKIEYWGIAPWNRDKCIRERVSIRTLSPHWSKQ